MSIATSSLLSPNVRGRVEGALCAAGVYRPARNAYQRLFNREFFDGRAQDREFLRRFIAPDSLVFDVGANEGRMTELFLELGARVVAVEPNPDLARLVRSRYRSRRVTVEGAAIGAELGTAELHLGVHNGHSTLSTEWLDAMEGDHAERWTGTVQVTVETLDRLIDRHGLPDFVKIDVEGFEAQVLAGLTQPIRMLSFEFLVDALDVAHDCIDRLGDLGRYELNLATGEGKGLTEPVWLSPERALQRLDRLRETNPGGYGDVYARLLPQA